MENFIKYTSEAEAKAAISAALLREDWQDFFCKDKHGEIIQYFFDEESVAKMARFTPIGMFDTEEDCQRLLKSFIAEKIDSVARFVARRGPLSSITAVYENAVGAVYAVNEENNLIKMPCYRINAILSRNRSAELGFCISAFSPIV